VIRRQQGEDEVEDDADADAAAGDLRELKSHQTGEAITVGNEFAEIRVSRVRTRNGARLLIEAPKFGQWVGWSGWSGGCWD
jgi:hypothetical protein